MKNWKKIISLTLCSAMLIGMTGCGADEPASSGTPADTASSQTSEAPEESADKPVTLSVYLDYSEDTRELSDWAAEKVKEEFPSVTLEFENKAQDNDQTLKTRAATGDLPDIIQLDVGTIDAMSKSGSIIQLDSYVDELNYRDKLLPDTVATRLVSPDGHIYQYPTGGASPILWYYNKALFEDNNIKVPTNYDELLDAVNQFNAIGITPFSIFAKEAWPSAAFFDSFVIKTDPAGVKGLSEGKAKGTDQGYQDAAKKVKTLIDAGVFQSGASNTDFDTAAAMFNEGRAAMFLNGDWFIADAIKALGDDADFFSSYPTADAGKEEDNKYAMAGGGVTIGMGVSANTEDQDLSARVAASFSYWRVVAEYQKRQFVICPIKTDGLTMEEPLSPLSEKLKELAPDFSYGSAFVHNLPNTSFATGFGEEMQKFIVGESEEEFLTNIDRLVESTATKQ